jgi:polyisoprenoid-binding protein YceI
MKSRIIAKTAGMIFLLLPLMMQAQGAYKISKSTMTISGTSNLHDWSSSVNDVKGQSVLSIENNAIVGISSLDISIPVISIKSSKGSAMDNRAYSALKSKEHSLISFQLTRMDGIEKTASGYRIKATGNLTIAGTKKSIPMTVDGKLMSDGSVNFKGSKALKMTDFNVSPPTAMMGAMTTGDDVTISFDITLTK